MATVDELVEYRTSPVYTVGSSYKNDNRSDFKILADEIITLDSNRPASIWNRQFTVNQMLQFVGNSTTDASGQFCV